MANVTPLRAVAQPTVTPISDWRNARWEWLERLEADLGLSLTARYLASVLVRKHGYDDDRPCSYSMKTMAAWLHVSVDTVKRTLKELGAAGWIYRTEGRGRTNCGVIIFLKGSNVVPMKALKSSQTVQPETPKVRIYAPTKGGAGAYQTATEKGANSEGKGRTDALSYNIAKTNLNKKEREANQAQSKCPVNIIAFVRPDDREDRIEDWNAWLTKRGYPTLQVLSFCNAEGHYALPSGRPPHTDDEQDRANQTAHRWATWATDCMEARHDH